MKKYLFIIILFVSGCGYQSIYSNNKTQNFEFYKITTEGENYINRKIVNSISLKEDKTNPVLNELLLVSSFKINETSKDKKGQIKSYRSKIVVNLTIKNNKNIIKYKTLSEEFTYNNKDNKFELVEYQENIKENLINKIIEDTIYIFEYVMIVKQFNLKNKIKEKINFYLLYGQNSGLIDETIDSILKPNFSKNIFYYDEIDLLSKIEEFKEEIFNKSFFENDKLIIISRATDKILQIIEDIIQIQNDDLKIIIKTSSLEKKSKLRNYFEKHEDTIIVPFYEDTHQSLIAIAQKFFYEKNKDIKSKYQLYYRESKGNRINLKNELENL